LLLAAAVLTFMFFFAFLGLCSQVYYRYLYETLLLVDQNEDGGGDDNIQLAGCWRSFAVSRIRSDQFVGYIGPTESLCKKVSGA
jgi:hypothetical protein